MESRMKERMDVIIEHIHLADKHKDRKIKLKITDKIYCNFGKTHYHIEMGFYNEDDTRCYDIIPYSNRLSWYIYHSEYRYIKDEELLERINNDIKKDYEWVTSIVSYFLSHHQVGLSYNWRPTLIAEEDTMIKNS